ncbi:UDP-glycosyltransferase 87A2-like [Corylus avellana]|uniref:UDP-glycosyltransferase 87A2-like n=1 Tax=Corylus avellana TaxID=13451 RepID=UPI00286A2576|nr:UDP-glycosyltransferase 87A2-like [Corylus avellana]
MDPAKTHPLTVFHVVAMPYPGRGNINPMMNLCKLLALRRPQHILVTFVVTEEWLGFIGSDPKPSNIRFATVPNVIPSELGRAKDFPGFLEAVSTKMEAPFEDLLDRLELPVTAILADTYVFWAIGVGNRRNIPVASLWPMSATVFSVLHHFELLVQHGHFAKEVVVASKLEMKKIMKAFGLFLSPI